MAGKKFVVEDIVYKPKEGGFVEIQEIDSDGNTKVQIIPVANVGYLYRGLAFDEDDEEIIAELTFKNTNKASIFNEYNSIQLKWRAYIKDQMDLTSRPKAYVTLDTFDISEDLLTTANSSFTLIELPENISEGDILTVYDPYGSKRYHGVISSIDTENKQISTTQIQSIFAGTWLYDLPSFLGTGNNKQWKFSIYDTPKEDNGSYSYLYPEDLESFSAKSVYNKNDSDISMKMNLGDLYTCYAICYVYSEKRVKVDISFCADDLGTLTVNGNRISTCKYSGSVEDTTSTESCVFRKGWNKVEVVYSDILPDDNGWQFDIFDSLSTSKCITASDLNNLSAKDSYVLEDSDTKLNMSLVELGNAYSARAKTNVYCSTARTVNLTFAASWRGSLIVNGTLLYDYVYDSHTSSNNTEGGEPVNVNCNFNSGWNTIEVIYSTMIRVKSYDETTGKITYVKTKDGFTLTENGSKISSSNAFDCMSSVVSTDDGFTITYNNQKLSECGLFTQFTSESTNEVTSLEQTFADKLKEYTTGNMRDSSYVDPVVAKRLGSFDISVGTNTIGSFTSQDDTYTIDMEQQIYNLYHDYQIMCVIDIPYEGNPTCLITKSQIEEFFKVSDNNNAITNLSPITEVEDTNRVIIYDSDGIYRTTYAVKSDGSRVEQPSEISSRFGVVNTSIVMSNDPIEDLLKSNLPEELYNHKLTFTLRLIGSLYEYSDFIMGMPLKIWNDKDYYQTILTGRDYSKESNKQVTEIDYTCGTVRTSLTKKLTTKFGVIK